ncbi:hypothetical protein ACLOJK_028313, partial [Asimina triloba]
PPELSNPSSRSQQVGVPSVQPSTHLHLAMIQQLTAHELHPSTHETATIICHHCPRANHPCQ